MTENAEEVLFLYSMEGLLLYVNMVGKFWKVGIINVNGGFIASTQNITDTAFMQDGSLLFSGSNTGSIEILGKVRRENSQDSPSTSDNSNQEERDYLFILKAISESISAIIEGSLVLSLRIS